MEEVEGLMIEEVECLTMVYSFDQSIFYFLQIPDIRLFWSADAGVTHQFEGKSPDDVFEFVPVSQFPQKLNDMAFWLPEVMAELDQICILNITDLKILYIETFRNF